MLHLSSIRLATESDIARIQETARTLTKELGYLGKGQIVALVKAKKTLICEVTGAFCQFNKRRDGVSVIYTIAVPLKHRSKGIGRRLVEALGTPVRLKCILGLPANRFYEKCGFKMIGVEKSTKTQLLVWEKRL